MESVRYSIHFNHNRNEVIFRVSPGGAGFFLMTSLVPIPSTLSLSFQELQVLFTTPSQLFFPDLPICDIMKIQKAEGRQDQSTKTISLKRRNFMTVPLPEGELLRKAVRWISEQRELVPRPSLAELIDEAGKGSTSLPRTANSCSLFLPRLRNRRNNFFCLLTLWVRRISEKNQGKPILVIPDGRLCRLKEIPEEVDRKSEL